MNFLNIRFTLEVPLKLQIHKLFYIQTKYNWTSPIQTNVWVGHRLHQYISKMEHPENLLTNLHLSNLKLLLFVIPE
jgi:hypothetical protein